MIFCILEIKLLLRTKSLHAYALFVMTCLLFYTCTIVYDCMNLSYI